MNVPEKLEGIKSPAIQRDDGMVFEGKNHGEIFIKYGKDGSLKTCRQGFTTTFGRFVDRTEAWRIAVATGQINTGEGSYAVSEDFYAKFEQLSKQIAYQQALIEQLITPLREIKTHWSSDILPDSLFTALTAAEKMKEGENGKT